MRRSARGQSEVVGVILVTAVVLVLVTLIGAAILFQWESETEDEPRTAIESELDATTLTLRHQGGDRLPAASVRVALRGNASADVALTDFSDGAGYRFEPGSTWRHDAFATDIEGVVVVLVIHDPSNTVLHEETHEVP